MIIFQVPLKQKVAVNMKRSNRWSTIFFVLLLLFSHSISWAASTPQSRPNVLVILVDDLGYGDLSGYGATDLKSPHIDALLNRGMKFRNFYANCPVCSPTRAALLTGHYQLC